MGKRLYFNHEARRLLQAGVDELANTVKVTLGPEGPQRRARAARRARRRSPTTASRSRARSSSSDQYKNMGAQLVREVANKTSDLTGDGTTTATLLAQAIVREGMRALDEGANPMLLRRGIEEATAAHRRPSCSAIARPVEGATSCVHVATIAAKEDDGHRRRRGRGARRASAPRAWSRSRSPTSRASRVDFVEGMVVENGWLSPYMVRDTQRMETVFEDPLRPHDQQADQAPERPAADRSTRSMKDPRPLVILCRERRGARARHARRQQRSTGRSRPSRCARPASATGASSTSATSPRSSGGTVIAEEAGLSLDDVQARALRHARGA